MASWIISFLSLFTISACLFLLNLLYGTNKTKKKKERPLPPCPRGLPIIGNLHQLGLTFVLLEPTFHKFIARYGPIFCVRFGPMLAVFVADRSLAHEALVQDGATFAGRPRFPEFARILNSNQHTISSAGYGPLWRLLRRNLIAETLSPARTKFFTRGRQWALALLISELREEAKENEGMVVVGTCLRRAIHRLLLFMCFGEMLEDHAVRKVAEVLKETLVATERFNILGFFPKLTKIFCRRKWREFLDVRRENEEALLPHILARRAVEKKDDRFCYVDSLITLELPDGRKLDDGEIVSLCFEFLGAGIDTTATALEWTMANLVKNPKIQTLLYEEIACTVSSNAQASEEYLARMPYLKAVIMESLRRHPPGHFLLPHAVAEDDASLHGYAIPKNATINFMVGEMGLDERVWKDPLEFRPERFLAGGEGEDVDITGNREIKMMPFGAGRRVCPGMGVAMLHLQYLVANLVRELEWSAADGELVDLAEKWEFTVVMKNPLKARIKPRNGIAAK
ncbi:cytochrome P450 89A2-like [Nymphaea colorata]|uniref:Cytochrome P450 n=1 Tax=Nymphaea colorata TaxID=210225 RepID=A0A5K1D7G0_9MAGN|nr:cytochrome P450 89A2-like [Nymphaea colorata]